MDTFIGTNSANDVSQPALDWMVNRMPTQLTTSVTQTSTSIPVGNIVSFYVSVSGGTPPYSYQWYQGTSAIGNSAQLAFYPNTAGTYTYTCKITDADGTTTNTSTLMLSVATPATPQPPSSTLPTITPQPTPTPSETSKPTLTTSPTASQSPQSHSFELSAATFYALAAFAAIIIVVTVALVLRKRAK
jgi:hypothetical protein